MCVCDYICIYKSIYLPMLQYFKYLPSIVMHIMQWPIPSLHKAKINK